MISFVEIVSVQECSSTFKVFYLCSKYPHFNSTYLVRVPFSLDQGLLKFDNPWLDLSVRIILEYQHYFMVTILHYKIYFKEEILKLYRMSISS